MALPDSLMPAHVTSLKPLSSTSMSLGDVPFNNVGSNPTSFRQRKTSPRSTETRRLCSPSQRNVLVVGGGVAESDTCTAQIACQIAGAQCVLCFFIVFPQFLTRYSQMRASPRRLRRTYKHPFSREFVTLDHDVLPHLFTALRHCEPS